MKKMFLILTVFASVMTFAQQPSFSIATHVVALRNLTPKEKFWSIGQNVQVSLHLSPRESGYASLEYYTEGQFKNNFTAVAKTPSSNPPSIAYTATGRLRYRQISLGWKHYFKGAFNAVSGVNIYGEAGFGYLFSKVKNNTSFPLDTALYNVPVAFGEGQLKRLSLDAGIGAELHLGGPVYTFVTLRTWLPASYHSSPFLHNSDRVPLSLMAGMGLRILFDSAY